MRLGIIMMLVGMPLFGTIIQNTTVTNNVIYGSGSGNLAWTVDRANGIELGLRSHTRFPVPLDQFNTDGAGTFYFPAGNFGPSGTQPSWNFDWSINSNYLATVGGPSLSAFTYRLELDTNTSAAVTFAPFFDPINQPCLDNAIGNNGTAASSGASVACPGGAATYAVLIGSNNLGQNSWRYTFFPGLVPTFDPAVEGIYTIRLSAYSGANLFAQTSIDVVATPEPAALGMIGAGLAGLVLLRRLKSRSA